MIKGYLIEKSDINAKRLNQLIEVYQDINIHLELDRLEKGLITILTDQQKSVLAIDLGVDGKNLQEVNFKGKRVTNIKTVIFCFDDPSIELTEKYIGEKLFRDYSTLLENSRRSNRVKNELDVSLRKDKAHNKTSEEPAMADLSSVKEFLVPKWTQNDGNGLESYITELKSAKAMQVLSTDAMLIYASLVKSGRSEVHGTLNDDQKNDLDEFVSYLRNSFGPTQQERRFGFQRLKQLPEEDCVNYFIRTEKMYFQSKNMTKPTGAQFLDQYKEDIKFQFIQGLSNPEVKRLMYLNGADTDYDNIASLARNYAVSLKDLNTIHTVNKVTEVKDNVTDKVESDRIESLEQKMDKMVLAINDKKDLSQVQCFACGYKGHLANQCQASAKTKAKHNRSRSRDRERRNSSSFDRRRDSGRPSRSRSPSPPSRARPEYYRSRSPRYRTPPRYQNPRPRYGRSRTPYYETRTYYQSRSRSPQDGYTEYRGRGRQRSRSQSGDRYYDNNRYYDRPRSSSRGRRVRFQ